MESTKSLRTKQGGTKDWIPLTCGSVQESKESDAHVAMPSPTQCLDFHYFELSSRTFEDLLSRQI
jgi:hypothetical protein